MHHFKSIGEFKLKLQSANAQLGSKLAIFMSRDLEIWWMTLEKNRAPLLHYIKLCASFQSHVKLELQSGNAQFGSNSAIFVPCDLEIWWMTLKNNRAPLLCCFKLSAQFCSHWWIQIGVTVRNRPIWVKMNDFISRVPGWGGGGGVRGRVTLKFDGWPWKTIGHLSWATSSSVRHFIIICGFKLELWSGNG